MNTPRPIDSGAAQPLAVPFTQPTERELFDVAALLSAAVDRIDSSPVARGDDEMHNTQRLVMMARDKVRALLDAA